MDTYHTDHFENALSRFRATERSLGWWLKRGDDVSSTGCISVIRQIEDLDGELGKMRHHARHAEYPFDEIDAAHTDIPSPEEFQRQVMDELRTAEATLKAVSKKIATKCVRAT